MFNNNLSNLIWIVSDLPDLNSVELKVSFLNSDTMVIWNIPVRIVLSMLTDFEPCIYPEDGFKVYFYCNRNKEIQKQGYKGISV